MWLYVYAAKYVSIGNGVVCTGERKKKKRIYITRWHCWIRYCGDALESFICKSHYCGGAMLLNRNYLWLWHAAIYGGVAVGFRYDVLILRACSFAVLLQFIFFSLINLILCIVEALAVRVRWHLTKKKKISITLDCSALLWNLSRSRFY